LLSRLKKIKNRAAVSVDQDAAKVAAEAVGVVAVEAEVAVAVAVAGAAVVALAEAAEVIAVVRSRDRGADVAASDTTPALEVKVEAVVARIRIATITRLKTRLTNLRHDDRTTCSLHHLH
jgi:hypothetical protein